MWDWSKMSEYSGAAKSTMCKVTLLETMFNGTTSVCGMRSAATPLPISEIVLCYLHASACTTSPGQHLSRLESLLHLGIEQRNEVLT